MPVKNKKNINKINKIKKINENYKKGSEEATKRAENIIISRSINQDYTFDRDIKYKDREYSLVSDNMKLQEIIKNVIFGVTPLMICHHLRIPVKFIKKLLNCTLTPKDIHFSYLKMKEKGFNRIEKYASINKGFKINKKSRYKGSLPFIFATPDIIKKDRVVILKSFKKTFNNEQDALLNLLITMEITGKFIGELHIYNNLYNEEDRIFTTKLIKIIGVKKVGNVFIDKFITYACRGYVTYLVLLLNTLGTTVSIVTINSAIEILTNNAKIENDKVYKMFNMFDCDFCFQVLPFVKYFISEKKDSNKGSTFENSDEVSNFYYHTQDSRRNILDEYIFNLSQYKSCPYTKDIYSKYAKKQKKTKSFDQQDFFYKNKIVILPKIALKCRFKEIKNKNIEYDTMLFDDSAIDSLISYYTEINKDIKKISDFKFMEL